MNDTTDTYGELYRDAGLGSLKTLTGATGTTPAFPSVARHENLEGFPLRDVVNDTKSRAFCGPTAVAAITGATVSLVRDAYRFVRHGSGWVDWPRAPAIVSTRYYETEKVLRLLGFIGSWQPVVGSPTVAAFLEARSGAVRTHPCAVFVTGHVVAVSGWQFCDTFSKGEVVEADDAPRRRARVKRVFVITGRVPPTRFPHKAPSTIKALASRRQKERSAYIRLLAGLGAKHQIIRDEPGSTVIVTFADGRRVGLRFEDWDQALSDLKEYLDDPNQN